MKRRPKKGEIILIGVLVATVLWVLSLDSKVKRARAKNRAAKASAQNPVQAALEAVDRTVRPQLQIAAGDLSPFWGADPFDRPFTREFDMDELEVGDEVVEKPDALVLYGVIIGERGATALIDRTVCEVGDTISGYRVEAISKERVLLRRLRDGSTRELTVE
jgi:hypothetical protein